MTTNMYTTDIQIQTIIPPKVGGIVEPTVKKQTNDELKEQQQQMKQQQITTQISSQSTFGSDSGYDHDETIAGMVSDKSNDGRDGRGSALETVNKEVEQFTKRVTRCKNLNVYSENILYIFAGVFSAAIYTFLILDLSFLKTRKGLKANINKDRFVICHFVRMFVFMMKVNVQQHMKLD